MSSKKRKFKLVDSDTNITGKYMFVPYRKRMKRKQPNISPSVSGNEIKIEWDMIRK